MTRSAAPGAGTRILVIEPDRAVGPLLRSSLRDMGFSVSGITLPPEPEALARQVRSCGCDAILYSLRAVAESPADLCELVAGVRAVRRADGETGDYTPIIAGLVSPRPRAVRMLSEAGVDHVLAKLLSINQILVRLKRLLAERCRRPDKAVTRTIAGVGLTV